MTISAAQAIEYELENNAEPRQNGLKQVLERSGTRLYLGDSRELCEDWPSPTVIMVDGPYGLASFPGDPATPNGLAEWYRPHIEVWARRATPETTLWFWNSEIGWATAHPVLAQYGWQYRSCHIWDKGKGHVAGNANSKTLRKFPVVSEVCVQYVRAAEFNADERVLNMQEWLRYEWMRTRLPFYKANEACGVRNAATRKYLTACHLWYFPPVEMFVRLAEYANRCGLPSGRPFFSRDGKRPISGDEWGRMRAKFKCDIGITNVWHHPQVAGRERVKLGTKCLHMNQKPLKLMELILNASSEPGDAVWEPFGGLCTTAIAARRLRRRCYSAELNEDYYEAAARRLEESTPYLTAEA